LIFIRFAGKNVFAVEVESEKQTFVVGIVADYLRVGYDAAFHYLRKPEYLAEAAFEVEFIALVGDKPHVALAFFERFDESGEFYAVHFNRIVHMGTSFLFVSADIISETKPLVNEHLDDINKFKQRILCYMHKISLSGG